MMNDDSGDRVTIPRSARGEIVHVARARVRHHRGVNGLHVRRLALAVCVAPACASWTAPERNAEPAEAPAEAAAVEAVAPPAEVEPAATTAPRPRPGPLRRLLIGEGWGCVVDEAGELWCWGHGPEPAPPWQAVRVATPGPVLAIASDREPGGPPRYVTCASFAEADARCWEHSARGGTQSWGRRWRSPEGGANASSTRT